MRYKNILKTASLIAAVLVCFAYSGSRQPAIAHDYNLAVIEPVTIPLWGPTWNHFPVTYSIEANRGITDVALSAVQAAIDDWNHAIRTNFTGRVLNPGAFPFTQSEFLVPAQAGQTPDIIIRPKSGGGMVQGQALASTDFLGFFSGCKVNVSGKAFGSNNESDTVKSIAIQEIGHCLGLLHADNSQDVMHGTLQDPPNTVISECDIKGWDAVMAWLGTGVAALPTASSVSCGSSAGAGGVPDAVAVSTDKASYQNRETALITVVVTDDSKPTGQPVEGAQVTVVLTTANGGQLSASGSTSAQGVFNATYRVNSKRDGTGQYQVNAEACKSRTCKSGATSFTVN